MEDGGRPRLIEAQSLGVRFGAQWVFRRLEFSLGPGDTLGIFGPNGSGKSTLLRVLAGLLEASEGTVTRNDSTGYAALDLALYPQLTAREHLEIFGATRGIEPRWQELLDRVDLKGAADKRCGAFSSGMRARLRLALALQASPLVLLLDEPTASLDSGGRGLVAEIIQEQAKEGAVVLATNDASEEALVQAKLTLDA